LARRIYTSPLLPAHGPGFASTLVKILAMAIAALDIHEGYAADILSEGPPRPAPYYAPTRLRNTERPDTSRPLCCNTGLTASRDTSLRPCRRLRFTASPIMVIPAVLRPDPGLRTSRICRAGGRNAHPHSSATGREASRSGMAMPDLGDRFRFAISCNSERSCRTLLIGLTGLLGYEPAYGRPLMIRAASAAKQLVRTPHLADPSIARSIDHLEPASGRS
jgi:hypothetical protein